MEGENMFNVIWCLIEDGKSGPGATGQIPFQIYYLGRCAGPTKGVAK